MARPSLSQGRVKNFGLSSARGSAKKLTQETTTVVQLSRHMFSPKSVSNSERIASANNKDELKIQRRDCLSGVVLSAALLGFAKQAVALEPPPDGPYLQKFYEDCSMVSARFHIHVPWNLLNIKRYPPEPY
jgi:hypothetical protein